MEKKMLKMFIQLGGATAKMRWLWNIFKSIIGAIFLLIIKIYQYFISPLTGASCRYTPTCLAIRGGGYKKTWRFKGGWLTLNGLPVATPGAATGMTRYPDLSFSQKLEFLVRQASDLRHIYSEL
jgi:putative component of membrane protein insertase Oxa1/YidC/SpoIIIJ protein YidD